MDDCVFCKIVKGEIPCFKIYEDDNILSFLTISPYAEGHTLVIPKIHVDHIYDLKDSDYNNLMQASKKIGKHLREKTGKKRVVLAVEGLEIPHAHVHLIPVDKGLREVIDEYDDVMPEMDELKGVAERLRLE